MLINYNVGECHMKKGIIDQGERYNVIKCHLLNMHIKREERHRPSRPISVLLFVFLRMLYCRFATFCAIRHKLRFFGAVSY